MRKEFYPGTNQFCNPIVQERLKQIVNDSPYTVGEAAERIGVSRASLAAWMYKNVGMKIESLVCVADFFQVSLDYLTGRTDDPTARYGASDGMKGLVRESYERYLTETAEKPYLDSTKKYIAPWPYNLLDEIYKPYTKIPPADIEERVMRVVGMLAPRERQAILYYFRDGKTLRDVGKLISVSPERARQIIVRAARKMRHPSKRRCIDYTDQEIRHIIELDAKERDLSVMEQRLRDKESSILTAYEERKKALGKGKTIECLELSARSYNALKRADINTLEELDEIIEMEGHYGLLRLRNMGKKCVAEVLEKLDAYKEMNEGGTDNEENSDAV